MCILIAMSNYLCVWIGICTAIIEQPSDLWSYVCPVIVSLCTCVCVHKHVCACMCVCMAGVTIAY